MSDNEEVVHASMSDDEEVVYDNVSDDEEVVCDSMSDDEDDTVVEEIPVYLSQALADRLFLRQFQAWPADFNFESSRVIKYAIKPANQEVQMDLAMDVTTSNYDVTHGEQIALSVDGSKDKPHHDKYFTSNLMDKMSFQGTRVLADLGSTVVAYFSKKEVVLSPISGIVSMQPTFPYLDLMDKRAKVELKKQGVDVSGGEEEEEKQVTVKFARQETERVKKARKKSFHYLTKKSAEEPWYNTTYHHSTSSLAEAERRKLIDNMEMKRDETGSMCLKPEDYMDALLPRVQEEQVPSNIVSLNALRSLPLAKQIELVLMDVKVITFGQLSSVLAGSEDTLKLLRSVQQVAVLVLGNWVVRSDFLYPMETKSAYNGVPAEIMTRARDYILYLLGKTEGSCVDRRELSVIFKIPTEELKEILTQVAKLKPNEGWTFALPRDTDFIERYPDVVERQALWWEARYESVCKSIACTDGSQPESPSRKRESSMSDDSELPICSQPVNIVKPMLQKDSSMSLDTESGMDIDDKKME